LQRPECAGRKTSERLLSALETFGKLQQMDRRLKRTIDQSDGVEQGATAGVPSDAYLAERAGAGDEAAFEELFARHRFRVGRIAGRFFSRSEKVEDVIQDTFVKVFLALGDFYPQRGTSFSAWLSRIAINSCYDHLRRDRRRPENSINDITEEEALRLRARLHGGGSPSGAEEEMISRDLATKLLSRLRAEDRIVLGLLDVDGMSVAEISGLTGWSQSKIKVRAHRARSSLRKILGEYT
jgi:RNA polymerase sigma-70 factor (ECF subfamily)